MRPDARVLMLAGSVGALLGCGSEDPPADPDPVVLAAPVLLRPLDGADTGSARVAPREPAAIHPLRPRFMWASVAGAEGYQLQVDDGCALASYRRCELSSPEVDVRILADGAPRGGTSVHVLARGLEVSDGAPRGRRYFWRLRACASDRCGPWSEVRYVDAGRLHDDFDGDGYSDVVVGAPMHALDGRPAAGEVFVYYGAASGTPRRCDEGARCARIANPDRQAHARFGTSVASAGDLDGDGYADLLIGAPGQVAIGDGEEVSAQEGNVFVYYGGPAGIEAECDPGAGGRCARLDNPDDQVDGGFGHAVAGAGDVDADGYDDVIAGAPFQYGGSDEVAYDSGAAFVYYGSARGLATECTDARRCARIEHPDLAPAAELGLAVGGGGDLDADGYADVVIGSGSGTVLVYYGTARGVDTTCRPGSGERCARVDRASGRFGTSVAIAGDVGADGYDELLVGAFREPGARPRVFEGSVFVYRGSASGIAPDCDLATGSACARIDNPDASWTSQNPMEAGYVFFGASVAGAGDVNGDGHDDVLVGSYRRARLQSPPEFATDAMLLYGGPRGLSNRACPADECDVVRFARSPMLRPVDTASLASADANGDGYADVIVGTPLSTNPSLAEMGEATIFFGGPDRPMPACTPSEAGASGQTRCAPLPNPAPQLGGHFGASSG